MYIVRESERSYGYDFFFIICVLFGAFFVLNLMIAVQFTYLGAAFDEEERRQKEIKDKMNLKKKLKMEQEQEDSFFDDEEDSNQESQGDKEDRRDSAKDKEGKKERKKKSCLKVRPPLFCIKASNVVEKIVESEIMNRIIIGFIIINMLFLASEHYDQSEQLNNIGEIANLFFTVIFTGEMVLKLFGLGIKKYVSDGFNVFDGVIVIVSLIELFSQAESSGLSVLRAFRLMRVFKIIKSWVSLRKLLATVLESLGAITNLGVLTMLFIFISALLAK